MEHILVETAQVFEAHGYAAGTTNGIAERAGVSVGTLYPYFPSQEAVAVALLEEHVEETPRKLHEWVGPMVSKRHGHPAAWLDDVLRIMSVHEDKPRLQHMHLEDPPRPDRLREVLLRADREAVEAVAGLLRLFPEIGRNDLERSGHERGRTRASNRGQAP